MRRIALGSLLLAIGFSARGANPVESAALALVRRVVPSSAAQIRVEQISPGDRGADVFEVETRGGLLVLRGNSGVSIASALNWYLGNVAHAQMSWDGGQPRLAGRPSRRAVKSQGRVAVRPARVRTPNHCTFNYTMAWWDRARWEREIDWMALHGINMPLATTGQEAVMQATLRRSGMDDTEIRKYLVGPHSRAGSFSPTSSSGRGRCPSHG